ncbi:MAG: radical SAM protein [Caldilineaceae bacterium]|nr:radical SAM protein [Caldilineaceae bacterium]MBP8109713.1 radical SAM protein [Caldilineaceae bacterium]MBP8123460.1 radical SAM protein [Caldilineaceae bacterium]MBP9071664.1 radical SAM protein [Caldilineaceae bacterium]
MRTLLDAHDRPIHLSTAAGTLTLSFDGAINLSFDGEGRMVGVFWDKITYRRALDNRILAKWIDPARPGQRIRRFLDADERRTLLNRAYALTAEVSSLPAIRHSPLAPAWLACISAWDFPRLEAEADRFSAIYKPVSILPPDQYMAVVVQAAEGCSYNECTFCTFYRDRPFRIKSVAELTDHMAQIRSFLGRGLSLRRTLFLADANAVIIPQPRLLPLMDAVNEQFAIGPGQDLNGIYAFISAPDALRKSATDFRELAERNLRRVYVGLETGHDPLRAFLAKQGQAEDVLAAVQTIKAGGVSVGLIFMVGIGGTHFRDAHFADTIALLQRLPLGADDLIYLSPFVAGPDSPYVTDLAAAGFVPMSDDEIRAEEQRFKSALLLWAKARGVRVSHYDVREFVY